VCRFLGRQICPPQINYISPMASIIKIQKRKET